MKEGAHGGTAVEWQRLGDDPVSAPSFPPSLRGKSAPRGSLKGSVRRLEFISLLRLLSHKDYYEDRKIRTVLSSVVTPAFGWNSRWPSRRETAHGCGWRS